MTDSFLEVPSLTELVDLPVDVVPMDEPGVVAVTAHAGDRDAVTIAYQEGVIETRVPKDVYDKHFAMHERKYLGTPAGTELPIPPHKLDLLSTFPRVWHT